MTGARTRVLAAVQGACPSEASIAALPQRVPEERNGGRGKVRDGQIATGIQLRSNQWVGLQRQLLRLACQQGAPSSPVRTASRYTSSIFLSACPQDSHKEDEALELWSYPTSLPRGFLEESSINYRSSLPQVEELSPPFSTLSLTTPLTKPSQNYCTHGPQNPSYS